MTIEVTIRKEYPAEEIKNKASSIKKVIYILYSKIPYQFLSLWLIMMVQFRVNKKYNMVFPLLEIRALILASVSVFFFIMLKNITKKVLENKGIIKVKRIQYSFNEHSISCSNGEYSFSDTWENVMKLERDMHTIYILTNKGQKMILPRIQMKRSGKTYKQLKSWFQAKCPTQEKCNYLNTLHCICKSPLKCRM